MRLKAQKILKNKKQLKVYYYLLRMGSMIIYFILIIKCDEK